MADHRTNWPVKLTLASVQMCAERSGLADIDSTRAWMQMLVSERGRIVDSLPSQYGKPRSRSGYFMLVDGWFALGLAADRNGGPYWAATSTILDPKHREDIDPTTLRGAALLARIELTDHVVQRFQERRGGSADVAAAKGELYDLLEPTVRAQPKPPAWARTTPADVFLVAGGKYDEYVLPCRRSGGVRGFTATTLIVRDSELFELSGRKLLAKCVIDPAIVPDGSAAARLLDELTGAAGYLTWHRPGWAKHHPDARWWIVPASRTFRVTAPVSWNPQNRKPLTVLAVADRRSWLVRLFARLRIRSS